MSLTKLLSKNGDAVQRTMGRSQALSPLNYEFKYSGEIATGVNSSNVLEILGDALNVCCLVADGLEG